MSDFRSELNGTNLIRVFDYWSALCDPLQMLSGFLPNVMLIDTFHDPRRYRYRLVGTNVVGATGEGRTGRFLDNIILWTVTVALFGIAALTLFGV